MTLETGRGRHAFAEHGVVMLSPHAFVRMRELIATNKDLAARIERTGTRPSPDCLAIDVLADEIRRMKAIPPSKKREIGFDVSQAWSDGTLKSSRSSRWLVPKILTYEEWLQLPPVEDGTDEVVKGELRFMPPTHYPHAEIIEELTAQLMAQVDRKKVKVLGSNFGLMITREPLTCRSPDIGVVGRIEMYAKTGFTTPRRT